MSHCHDCRMTYMCKHEQLDMRTNNDAKMFETSFLKSFFVFIDVRGREIGGMFHSHFARGANDVVTHHLLDHLLEAVTHAHLCSVCYSIKICPCCMKKTLLCPATKVCARLFVIAAPPPKANVGSHKNRLLHRDFLLIDMNVPSRV